MSGCKAIPIVTTPGVYTGGLQPCNNTNKKVVEHGETHKVSLQYQITPYHMAYFTWSTGFRPGGNNRLPTASAYDADTLTNFELGWKTDWFEHRLRANGAVFYEKWFNVQTAVQGQYGITSIVNAGNARVEGIESALEWAATEHLGRVRCGHGPLGAWRPRRFSASPRHRGWSRARARPPSSMPIRARNCRERPR